MTSPAEALKALDEIYKKCEKGEQERFCASNFIADHFETIRTALSESGGWRDISTADKQEPILMCARHPCGVAYGVGRWSEQYQSYDWEHALEPTHWQPLPAPPKGGE